MSILSLSFLSVGRQKIALQCIEWLLRQVLAREERQFQFHQTNSNGGSEEGTKCISSEDEERTQVLSNCSWFSDSGGCTLDLNIGMSCVTDNEYRFADPRGRLFALRQKERDASF
jgi:hypothetical protein